MRRLFLDADRLREYYYKQKLPPAQIARKLGCSEGAVRSEMNRQGFIMRGISEAHAHLDGDKNPAWKGGRRKAQDGYILISIGKKRTRAEHIIVWEETYGRALPSNWVVHHLNGIRDDNRKENLYALSRGRHTRLELSEIYKKRIRQLERELKELKNGIQPLPLNLD